MGNRQCLIFLPKKLRGDEIVSDNNDNSESPTELAEGSVTPTESLMESDKSSEEAARSGESLTEHDESTESTSKCRIQPEKYDLQLVKKPNDSEKLDLLKCDWTFPRSHVFPATDVRGVSRRFNGTWLEKFVWLRYSESADGVFCIWCMLFEGSDNLFVKNAVRDWGNLGKYVKRHENSAEHLECKVKSENFIEIAEGKKDDVVSMSSSAYAGKIERNRGILKSILKVIVLCGRQNIALRGHTEEKSNFMALVNFRAETDLLLAKHLKESPPNARYLSPQIQNEFIELCGDQIRDNIVKECTEAKFFSLIADEVTDKSTTEQISMCVRFMGKDENGEYCLKESFVCFTETSSTTGEEITQKIIDKFNELGLIIDNLRGQGYDGAGNMAGKFSGVQARIKEIVPSAEYVHCYAHCLNLSVVKSCQLPLIRNMMDVVKEISYAFSYSAKRTGRFKTYLEGADDETTEALEGRKKIKTLCETRWSSRADALHMFKDAYQLIIDTLGDLATDGDKNAVGLKRSMQDFGFLVCLTVCEHVLQISLKLSNFLQNPSLDLVAAATEADDVVKTLRHIRGDDGAWQKLYADTKRLANTQNIEPTKPRTAGRQMHRDNLPGDTPELYWKRSVFYPLLDHLATEIESRIITPKDRFLAQYLIPSKLHLLTPEKEATVFMPFAGDLPDKNFQAYKNELLKWKCKWENRSDKPSDLIQTLKHAHPDFYPNIHVAVKILLTMPVSSATAERSFSSLKRIKTYLRSTMVEDRLNGLSLMHIHRDHQIDLDRIIQQFAADGNRRIRLIFPY